MGFEIKTSNTFTGFNTNYRLRADKVICEFENLLNVKVIDSKYMAIRLHYCKYKSEELMSNNNNKLYNALSNIFGECYALLNEYFTKEFLEQLYDEYSKNDFKDRYRFYIYSSFELQNKKMDKTICGAFIEDSIKADLTETESIHGMLILDNLSDYYKVTSDNISLVKIDTINLDEVARDLVDRYDITIKQALEIIDPDTED